MSLYVEWLNQIKAMADQSWLTDSQRIAYDSILNQWLGNPFVCLCGSTGAGKSFIARLFARKYGYIYTNELRVVEPGPYQIVVDGEDYSRLMRSTALLLKVKRVIVLARNIPRDPMPHTEIVLTEHDVKQFQHNLTKNGIIKSFTTHIEGTDLGKILRAEAIAREETNATR